MTLYTRDSSGYTITRTHHTQRDCNGIRHMIPFAGRHLSLITLQRVARQMREYDKRKAAK